MANKYQIQSSFPKFDHSIDNIDELEDNLHRNYIVDTLVNDIRGENRPRVIGIYGWWGAGKSYLLSLAIKQLLESNRDSKQQVIIVTYNPWRYEMEGDLARGLIKSLNDVDKKFTGKNPNFDQEKRFKKVALEILGYLSKISKFIPIYGEIVSGLAEPAITSAKEIMDNSVATQPEIADADKIQVKIQELVNGILDSAYKVDSTKDYRLVVFIDDLDRCSPENMVKLLEWLKVHLSVEGCIYVLALDHIAAARAIVGQYKKYLANDVDLAYGLRYLEKLVENEYELGTANFAENMALKRIDQSSNLTRISQIAVKLSGGDFPGVNSINELMKLRSLLNPRTMLKISYKFKRAMDVLDKPESVDLRTQLPSSYPFWVITLVAMYYSVDPSVLDDFVRGRGSIYQLIKNPGSISSEDWGTGPIREFCQFADRLGTTTSSSLQLPSNEILFKLISVIRENSYAR
jgi:hypothetical protein